MNVYSIRKEPQHDDAQKKAFIEGLMRCQKQGIPVLIDGRKGTRKNLLRLFAAEPSAYYMGDYISDDRGVLREIRFDKIQKKE